MDVQTVVQAEKEAAYDALVAYAREHPELVELIRPLGMAYGWKFVGRALTGWTLARLLGE